MNHVLLVGEVSEEYKATLSAVLEKQGLSVEYDSIEKASNQIIISLTKDAKSEIENKITERVKILHSIYFELI